MNFDLVVESMLGIGFEEEEIQDIQSVLAAVILIGDIVRHCEMHACACVCVHVCACVCACACGYRGDDGDAHL